MMIQSRGGRVELYRQRVLTCITLWQEYMVCYQEVHNSQVQLMLTLMLGVIKNVIFMLNALYGAKATGVILICVYMDF